MNLFQEDYSYGMADPFLLIPTGPSSEPISFEKPEDFIKFWQDFLGEWNWVRNGNWSRVVEPYGTFFDQINNAVQQINSFKNNPAQLQNAKNVVIGQLDIWKRKSPPILYPKSPEAIFVLKIHQKYGFEAAQASLSYFTGTNINLASTGNIKVKFLAGFLEAFLFENGITDPTPYQSSILNDFINHQNIAFSKTKKAFDDTLANSIEKMAHATKESIEIKQRADKQSSDFQLELENSKKRMKDFEDTYNAKLALLAPVTYWRKKAKNHLWLSIVFGMVSLNMGVSIGFYIVGEVQQFLNTIPGQKPDTWRIGVLLVVGGLFIYLLRIIVKIFLSQVHLQADSSQRAIMVETYLALEREGKLASDDKKLILEALFRLVGTGLVQDDQAAVGLAEGLISKLK